MNSEKSVQSVRPGEIDDDPAPRCLPERREGRSGPVVGGIPPERKVDLSRSRSDSSLVFKESNMVKRALCVGINDYPYADNDLKGCVNDARAWAELLTSHFDFAAADVKVLEDSEATKANLLAALENLVRDAQEGDVL